MENMWKPLIQGPEYHQIGNQLNNDLNSVRIALDKLRKECQDDLGNIERNLILFAILPYLFKIYIIESYISRSYIVMIHSSFSSKLSL